MAVAFEATNTLNAMPFVYFFLFPLKFPTLAVAPGATKHWQTCWKAATRAGEFQLKMMAALFSFSFPLNCLYNLAKGHRDQKQWDWRICQNLLEGKRQSYNKQEMEQCQQDCGCWGLAAISMAGQTYPSMDTHSYMLSVLIFSGVQLLPVGGGLDFSSKLGMMWTLVCMQHASGKSG